MQAIEALRLGNRKLAVDYLTADLAEGGKSGHRWHSISKLAFQIGAIDIGLEASRRYSHTAPVTIERLLHYWGDLTSYGRSETAIAAARALPAAQQNDAAILHFIGTVSGQDGDFLHAEKCYRQALAITPYLPQTWFALSMIKKFEAGDTDLAMMERLDSEMSRATPEIYARFVYALAKAWHDIGDAERSFTLYSKGAQIRRQEQQYDKKALEDFTTKLTQEFTIDAMRRLYPSHTTDNRVMFVNGLPRSGTTLVEQILASHSQVEDGGEINLFRAALIPTIDYSFIGAINYQNQLDGVQDVWSKVAADYFKMLEMRFQTTNLVIDKTLNQSYFMGLILHTLPNAKVIWMRRNPEDTALSCFRSFFSSPLPWSLSLNDIAHYFRIEDQLYKHWTHIYPERILTIQYEDLVRLPEIWIPQILSHVGLSEEHQVYEFYLNKRSVRTASVQQVRSPITTSRINSSEIYKSQLEPFRNKYFL